MPKFEVRVKAHESRWTRFGATIEVEAEDEKDAVRKAEDILANDDDELIEWQEEFDDDDLDPKLEIDSVEVDSTIEDEE